MVRTVSTVYQHDSNGYYVGKETSFDGLMPSNCVLIEPTIKKGYIPKWDRFEWVQIENHVGEEGFVNNVQFTITEYGPYPNGWTKEYVYSLEELKNNKIAELNGIYSSKIYDIKGDTPDTESETWSIQKEEVSAWYLDKNTPTPFCDIIAMNRSMDREVFLMKVLQKTLAYRNEVGKLTGKLQQLKDKLKNSKTKQDVESIVWVD